MHPFLRLLATQVADAEAAWSRLLAAIHPEGVTCPRCVDTICMRKGGRPPYDYECALCDLKFGGLEGAPVPLGAKMVPWTQWLHHLVLAVAFGPRGRHRPPVAEDGRLRRAEAAREGCDRMVQECPDLAAATLGLRELPRPMRNGLAEVPATVKVDLPQEEEAEQERGATRRGRR